MCLGCLEYARVACAHLVSCSGTMLQLRDYIEAWKTTTSWSSAPTPD